VGPSSTSIPAIILGIPNLLKPYISGGCAVPPLLSNFTPSLSSMNKKGKQWQVDWGLGKGRKKGTCNKLSSTHAFASPSF
jgi:hypothetical protein